MADTLSFGASVRMPIKVGLTINKLGGTAERSFVPVSGEDGSFFMVLTTDKTRRENLSCQTF
ncbi:hypothetical protein LAC03_16170 [Levilactobacillus acidifarinae]|nr:hypothetical protein LAC03_16170 [Levilactobacillus acidifarinae]